MQIDLSKIIEDKNPKLSKRIPRFVLWIANKILYVKSVNRILSLFSHLKGVAFTRAMLDELKIKREVKGLENLRSDGRYVFASNHPLGGLDGLSLVEAIDRRYSGVKVISNDILMSLTPLQDLFLPINKHGRQSVEYAKLIANHFEQGKAIIFFPAGLCSRKIHHEIKDSAWKKSYLQKAIDYQYDVVPVFVNEVNSPLFYNLEILRSKLNIKLNIGMLLLPHELFRRSKRQGSVRMVFGEPITYNEIVTTQNVDYWNEEIRRRCYKMEEK